jgi:hypothetical protein
LSKGFTLTQVEERAASWKNSILDGDISHSLSEPTLNPDEKNLLTKQNGIVDALIAPSHLLWHISAYLWRMPAAFLAMAAGTTKPR